MTDAYGAVGAAQQVDVVGSDRCRVWRDMSFKPKERAGRQIFPGPLWFVPYDRVCFPLAKFHFSRDLIRFPNGLNKFF